MLPSEIIPALPRQKVKHVESGEIFYVIGPHPTEKKWVMLLTMDGFKDEAPLGNLEPVPEEPRPFRVGDKVKCVYTSVFSTIKQVRIAEKGWPEQYEVDDVWKSPENIRHATPEEISRHFAHND